MSRKSTSGSLKLLVNADGLMNTLNRLHRCRALLIQSIDFARSKGLPTAHTLGIIAICELLETVTDDFCGKIGAALDIEEEARERRRQRTSPERKQEHERS